MIESNPEQRLCRGCGSPLEAPDRRRRYCPECLESMGRYDRYNAKMPPVRVEAEKKRHVLKRWGTGGRQKYVVIRNPRPAKATPLNLWRLWIRQMRKIDTESALRVHESAVYGPLMLLLPPARSDAPQGNVAQNEPESFYGPSPLRAAYKTWRLRGPFRKNWRALGGPPAPGRAIYGPRWPPRPRPPAPKAGVVG
jgi:uncharacterized protein YjiS (DUF1127 family)